MLSSNPIMAILGGQSILRNDAMSLVSQKDVGACFKRPDGTTYTLWWSKSGWAWQMTASHWIKEKIFWDNHLRALGIGKDGLMCIVRSK